MALQNAGDTSYADTLVNNARDLFDFADNYRQFYDISMPGAYDFYQ